MFTPPAEHAGMPPLVDNPPFYPPGLTEGGQPHIHSAFPGARSPTAPGPPAFWGPPGGTPYVPPNAVPWTGSSSSVSSPPASAASASPWTFGGNAWGGSWGAPPHSAPAIPGPAPNSAPPFPNGYPSPYTTTNTHGAPWPSAPATPGAAAASGWPSSAAAAPWFTGAPPPGTPYAAAAPYPSPYPSPGAHDGGGGAYGWSPAHQLGGGGMEYPATPSKRSRRKSKSHHEHEHEHVAHAIKHSTSLRSRSRSRTRFDDHAPLHRSLSYGGASPYAPMPAYARGDMFDEQNLSRRPTDWRSDYVSPHSGVLDSLRPVVMKHKTIVQDWTDPVRRDMHPLLAYRPSAVPLSYDLRSPFFHPSLLILHLPTPIPMAHSPFSHSQGHPSPRPANTVDLLQLALNPSYPFLRLFHPMLPWYIDIHASQESGVTVVDVVQGLSEQLQQAIHGRHYWNEALTRRDREEINDAFAKRARHVTENSAEFGGWGNDAYDAGGHDPWGAMRMRWAKGGAEQEYSAVVARGVLQVDFLGDKCVFEGLVRGPKGMWEIKTRRA